MSTSGYRWSATEYPYTCKPTAYVVVKVRHTWCNAARIVTGIPNYQPPFAPPRSSALPRVFTIHTPRTESRRLPPPFNRASMLPSHHSHIGNACVCRLPPPPSPSPPTPVYTPYALMYDETYCRARESLHPEFRKCNFDINTNLESHHASYAKFVGKNVQDSKYILISQIGSRTNFVLVVSIFM